MQAAWGARQELLSGGRRDTFLFGGLRPYGRGRPAIPRFDADEIQTLSFLFLTHSHTDHTGALPWLEEQGFSGTVFASRETLSQLKASPRRAVCLERFTPPTGLMVDWGRSGHCGGSIWYQVGLEGHSILFSGDYTEHSLAYTTDLIRNVKADLAVLDSAYGPEPQTAAEMRRELLTAAERLLTRQRSVLFPVPKFGRGLELALLLHKAWPGSAHLWRWPLPWTDGLGGP